MNPRKYLKSQTLRPPKSVEPTLQPHIFERDGQSFYLVGTLKNRKLEQAEFMRGCDAWNRWFDEVRARPGSQGPQWKVVPV